VSRDWQGKTRNSTSFLGLESVDRAKRGWADIALAVSAIFSDVIRPVLEMPGTSAVCPLLEGSERAHPCSQHPLHSTLLRPRWTERARVGLLIGLMNAKVPGLDSTQQCTLTITKQVPRFLPSPGFQYIHAVSMPVYPFIGKTQMDIHVPMLCA